MIPADHRAVVGVPGERCRPGVSGARALRCLIFAGSQLIIIRDRPGDGVRTPSPASVAAGRRSRCSPDRLRNSTRRRPRRTHSGPVGVRRGLGDPVKVLFIAGFGRSGTTLLDNLVGSLEGWLSLGELAFIWDRSLRDDRLCGCGEAFHACPFWSPLRPQAFGELDAETLERLIATREALGPGRVLARSLGGQRALPDSESGLTELLERHQRLYRVLQEETGARVLVDSSKAPGYGYLLKQMPGVEPCFVHLVRDPRAVAFSWQKKKIYDDSGDEPMFMSRHSVAASCRLWIKWNLSAQILFSRPRSRYLRLRYEDFVANPRAAVGRIADLLDEPRDDGPFADDRTVRLERNHTVGGNPSRFRSGEVAIRRDTAWRKEMPRSQRLAVLALTWPLFLAYGYPRR